MPAGDHDRAADRLIAQYQAAQAALQGQLDALVANAGNARQRAQIRALIADIDREIERLLRLSRDWLADTMPAIYAAGAIAAGVGVFRWTAFHADAVQAIAVDVFSRFDDTMRTAKVQARRAITATVPADTPVLWVTYGDGARHTVSDYATMLLRTTTADSFNQGTLGAIAAAGMDQVLILDGPDCGLTSHDDGEKVNGRTYPLAVAAANRLAHPNCRRTFASPAAAATVAPLIARPPIAAPTRTSSRTPRASTRRPRVRS